jgi:proline racemase
MATRSASISVRTAGRLIEIAARIIPAVNQQLSIRHPKRPDINRCYQTLFTSAKVTVGDVRQTILVPPGAIDRSPCGTGTSARVALMHTRGELPLNESRRFEGPLGTFFTGTPVAVRLHQRDAMSAR